MLGPRHVIRTAAMQVAIRIGLLVQRTGIPRAQHLRDHPLILRFRTVAIHHALRLGQLRRFIDPGFQWSCHPDLPASPTFRRHNVQRMPRRSLAAPVTLWVRTPTRSGTWFEWTRPCQQTLYRRELPARLARLLLYPPTVYVTPRRPRKPLPLSAALLSLAQRKIPVFIFLCPTSLLPSCCKLVSLDFERRIRPLARRPRQSAQSPQHGRCRPRHE